MLIFFTISGVFSGALDANGVCHLHSTGFFVRWCSFGLTVCAFRRLIRPCDAAMALMLLTSRSHVLGQLFDVLAPYKWEKLAFSLPIPPSVRENILVTAISEAGVSLSISLFISLSFSNSISGGRMSDKCPPFFRRRRALFGSLAAAFAQPPGEDCPIKSSILLM